jgi:hypothetical protein
MAHECRVPDYCVIIYFPVAASLLVEIFLHLQMYHVHFAGTARMYHVHFAAHPTVCERSVVEEMELHF